MLSSDLFMLSHDGDSGGGCGIRGLGRQESRDSLIEVALDNTEQIVSKLLGKNSRVVLNARQPPLLDL